MSDTVALVTGGSRGIGRAIVELLVSEGRNVAFTYHLSESAARQVEQSANGRARAFTLNLLDHAGPDRVIREVEASMGPIDGLVNNAGVTVDGLAAMTTDRQWDDTIDLNVGGTFRCCRAVLAPMVHRRCGSIVILSSVAAFAATPGQAAYAASKSALLGFMRTLAREVGSRSVRVNCVVPGFVATDMTSGLNDEVRRRLRSRECLPAGTSALDVAHAVSFLLSPRSAAITGHGLIVDAGTSV